MTFRKSLVLVAGALLLASSAVAGFRDDAPAIKDPLEGLISRASLSTGDSGPIKDASNKRVAIILTGNTHEHLKWSDEAAREGRSGLDGFMGTLVLGADAMERQRKTIAAGYRADAITAAVLNPIVQVVKEVKLMNDLAEFRDSGFDVAAIIDVTFLNTFFDSPVFIGNKYETGTWIKAYFISRDLALGPVVEVGRKQEISRNGFWDHVGGVRTKVFAEYEASMRRVVGEPMKAATPGTATTADRLKELEELRRGGLISEAEAAEKRKRIIDGL